MKNTYQVLYGMSGVLLIIVLLGGSLTKPLFNSFSERTLETSGIKKASIDSLDNEIDNILYKVNKVQLQLEKLKNLFSDKEIDESKFQKQKNQMFYRNIYSPLNELAIVLYRVIFFFIAVILFLTAVIVHLVQRSAELRLRVSRLEEAINKNSKTGS